jgi:hypothetical protein
MLYNFLLVYHFDRVDLLAHFVPNFVNFAEAANANVAIS